MSRPGPGGPDCLMVNPLQFCALYPTEDGQKTIMNYSLRLGVSPAVPRAVADWSAKQNCKSWMENLKKRAESGGKWKK